MKKNCFARFAAAALSLAMLAGCGASQSSDSAAEDTRFCRFRRADCLCGGLHDRDPEPDRGGLQGG